MKVSFITDKGNKRKANEDSVSVIKNDQHDTLLLVADGMGGHKAGDVASNIAKTVLEKAFKEIKEEAADYKKFLAETIKEANAAIYKQSLISQEYSKMGTTLSVAIISGENIYLGHIGDSRIYYITKNKIRQLTKDHTVVQMLYDTGEITEDEIAIHPYRNVLMQSLGTNKSIKIDIMEFKIPLNSYLLLCSDGLTEDLNDNDILEIVRNSDSPDKKVDQLLEKALSKTGKDNISIILMERDK